MAKFLLKTKGDTNPKGKPKVYFTCHPEDFSRYFDKICNDIFQTHDCAIYYTEDMNERIAEEDRATDLGQMNLFVVPVTSKLLSQPNRAMDEDIAYAKRKHIAILPLMMELGLDALYEKPDKFGELQYLSPSCHTLAEIRYEEKLKKYLEAILISDEVAKQVRAAFDAYIFLSYRKRDRCYANELMKHIHDIPEYRDIAIWYDEFLTPGESFAQNIDKALQESKLFTLLVTPRLLETVNGKPNFVMAKEYPAAKQAGMPILPMEMEPTDKKELREKYEGIPECTSPLEEDAFRTRLLDELKKIAITKNDCDPMHNYLIGLAYLDGIDVEVNRERGLALITSAAEAGNFKAMRKLFDIYNEGKMCRIDYREAVKWAERMVEYTQKQYGEKHPHTLTALNRLASAYNALGENRKGLEINEKAYTLSCTVLGEEHPHTLTALSDLSVIYSDLGEHRKAADLQEKGYTLSCKIRGEEHPDTLTFLSNLAATYDNLGDYRKAVDLKEKIYTLRRKLLGEEDQDTLLSLNNLAATYYRLGEHRRSAELGEKAYLLYCKVLGEEHPDTLGCLNNLATTYNRLGEYQKAVELNEKVYNLGCLILGEEHPNTLTFLGNLGMAYEKLHEHKKALELKEKAYTLRCKILGEKHPGTLVSLNNLASTYSDLKKHRKAAELKEKAYTLFCEVLGEEHPSTLNSLNNLAITYADLGKAEMAVILMEKAYKLRAKVLGEDHPQTVSSRNSLEVLCQELHRKERLDKIFFWRKLFKK